MDYDSLEKAIDEAIEAGSLAINEITCRQPEYDKLSYSKHGVSAVFEQFKRVGANLVWLHEQLFSFEQKRSLTIGYLKNRRALIERDSKVVLQANIHKWVGSGFAHAERDALSKMQYLDELQNIARVEALIDTLGTIIDALKYVARSWQDFRQDARTVERLLSFGHQLGEL